MASFSGTSATDILIGGSGDDVLDGLGGADLLIGGAGDDVYIIDHGGDRISEGVGAGLDTVRSSVWHKLSDNIEILELVGTAGIEGIGNALDNVIVGNVGNNRLSGGGGNDLLNGGLGQDVAAYSGFLQHYKLGLSANGELTVLDINTTDGVEGKDTLEGIEKLSFNGANLSLGPMHSEFRVNSFTTDIQGSPVIATLADGGFVVVWESMLQDGSGFGVYAQRYDANGRAQGAEFQVNSETSSAQASPSITALAHGGFVVSWMSDSQDGSSSGIYAQRYDANGAAQGAEFRVNSFVNGIQDRPSITALADGGFVVSWDSNQDGSGFGVYAQRYDANGTTRGAEFQINSTTANNQFDPSITVLADDGFVVAWTSELQDGSSRGIYAQRYDANAVAQGAEFQVNSTAANSQSEPAITALAGGGFVVTWTSDFQDGSGRGIYAQRYDANAVAQGAEFQVNSFTTNDQIAPSIAALADGGFVVSWSSSGQDGSNFGVYAQRYDAQGNAWGAEFQVNTFTNSVQALSSIAALADGGFVVTWQSFNQDGSSHGIYAQRYNADGTIISIEADGGNNTLSFTGGSARLVGGKGNDIYLVDDDVVVELAGGGTDKVEASASFVLSANIEKLSLTGFDDIDATGNNLANTISGNSGSNILDGRLGADSMAGSFGNDIYIVDNTGDKITELVGGGVDSIIASVSYTLASNVEDLQLSGNANISGKGNGLNNFITGNGGNNNLTGGGGDDELIGGAGIDTAVYSGASTAYVLGFSNGKLAISGSEGADTLDGIEQLRFSNATLKINQVHAEFRVNTNVSQDQDAPSVAALADGGFVVTWVSDDQDTSEDGIYAQRYDASGAAQGAEFQVNSFTTNDQSQPSIAALADGGFVVSWTSDQDSSDNIYAQRYDANGVAVGAEFRVNTFTTSGQDIPNIAGLADGGFVVAWTSNGQDTSNLGIYAQRYDVDGVAAGTEFRVNSFVTDSQDDASIAALADGGFVVAWQSFGQDGSSNGIYAQHYDANGVTAGAEFRVNSFITGSQADPSITALADGGFVVAWRSLGQDGSGGGVYAQRYDADGIAAGVEFRVNSFIADDQDSPSIAALGDGGFVVVWESVEQDGSGNGIYAQRYNANGFAQGAEFRVNSTVADAQDDPRVAALADGGFVVTWQSFEQDGSDNGVYAQRYNADGTVVSIEGDGGNNTLSFTAGPARLIGGLGNDIYLVDDSSDTPIEAASGGTDTAKASVSFMLSDNIEHLTLTGTGNIDGTGNSRGNTIKGNSGNNVLDGGLGVDNLIGGAGNDTYVLDQTGDKITEAVNAGNDTVITSFSHTLGSNIENLQLIGVANFSGKGNTLNNRINGSFGNDSLSGEAGNDIIDGSFGADVLKGGSGNDSFVFSTDLGGMNVDQIADFNVINDTIVLDDDVFTGMALGVLDASAFVAGAVALDAGDRIIYNAGTGQLFYDADGSGAGAAQQFATVTVGIALTAADFNVIA